MTSVDLTLCLCMSFAMLGLASLYWAVRIFRRGRPISATFFSGLGALLLLVAGMMTVAPWRPAQSGISPMAVLDLNTPPAAIERADPGN